MEDISVINIQFYSKSSFVLFTGVPKEKQRTRSRSVVVSNTVQLPRSRPGWTWVEGGSGEELAMFSTDINNDHCYYYNYS
jgi:hypothetical protein